jgi:hypothetical protein
MSETAVAPGKRKVDYRGRNLSRQRFYSVDFSNQDLSKCLMKNTLFHGCNFDDADMSESECEGSEFFGSTFRNTICYRTNFKDAKLANTVFAPKDAFGITVSLQCKSFENMQVPQLWFLSWLLFSSMMIPDPGPIKQDFHADVLGIIGAERYVKLKALFGKRNF